MRKRLARTFILADILVLAGEHAFIKVASTDIPRDARRAWAEYDGNRDALMMVLEHPSFPEVDEDDATKFLRLNGPMFTAFDIKRDVERIKALVAGGDTDTAIVQLDELLAVLVR